MPKPHLSILIVSYNTSDLLKSCLLSVQRYPPPISWEIVVVDNASHDGSPELVEEEFPEVRLIRNSMNLGFAAANNKGLQVSRGDYLFFLNSDAELLPHSLDPLIDHLETHPHVGIVGPSEQFRNGRIYPTVCPFPNIPYLLFTHTGLRRRFYRNKWINPYRGLWERAQNTEKPTAVDWLSGASLLVRRKVFDDIGPFDEGYFFYMEETDLCARAHGAGWEVTFIPKARIIHHGGGSTDKAKRGLLTLSGAMSELRYFEKHRNIAELLLLRCIFFVEYSLKIILVGLDDPRCWAYREVLRAVLGSRPSQVLKRDLFDGLKN
jgi:GT2 family glycosyltransferase